jgi:succinyl-diaminopimelate desuccinylase
MRSDPLMSKPDLEALAATALALCQIPSVIGNEEAICNWVQARLGRLPSERGELVRHSHSLVLKPNRRDGCPLVILAGHLDTVPERQDRPASINGDWLEGCGASDMKSALAVMIHLIEDLDTRQLPVDLGLVLYEREEGPYEENYLGPLLELEPFLSQAELVVCMEPTDNRVEVGCLGCIHATLTFEGQRAHSARPWQGSNAVHKAGPLLIRLGQLKPVEVLFEGLAFTESSSITMVEGVGARNVIPDHFSMNLNYRFAPGKSLEQAQQDVLDSVNGEATVTFTDISPSGRVCLDNPLVQGLVARTGAALPKLAWTDVARFSVLGTDAVNCGPGAGAQAHQRNEGVSLAAVLQSYHLIRDWLQRPQSGSV